MTGRILVVVGLIWAATSAQAQNLSPQDLERRAVERRAVEAVIWGMPAVNYHVMYQEMVRKTKGGFNQVLYWSRLLDWKNQTLTPNPDVIYLMPFFNTKDIGPVVLEIPPADEGLLNGSIMDYWQAAIEDVGPGGVDKGQGGKYVVLEAAKNDPTLRQAMITAAQEADEHLITPLFQFRNYDRRLPHHWTTIANEAAFGTDYFTRTAVAKSNIFVNAPNETKYFYQDLDASGARLNGAHRYTVTFPKDQTPPVYGFWSLTLYNQHHFFAPNAINRYSLGTKNKTLKYNPDGSLTLYVQADPPPAAQRDNWLPAPKGEDISLYVRAYWPKTAVTDGSWTPPAVVRAN